MKDPLQDEIEHHKLFFQHFQFLKYQREIMIPKMSSQYSKIVSRIVKNGNNLSASLGHIVHEKCQKTFKNKINKV